MTFKVDQEEAERSLKKLTRRQIVELDTCAHCALCTENCPTFFESEKSNYSPAIRSSNTLQLYNRKYGFMSRIIKKSTVTEDEVTQLSDGAFNCTLCGRCMETCPFGIQTHELWVKVREIVHDLECVPQNVLMLEKMLKESRNPYGLDEDMRLDWTFYTGLEKVPERDEAEVAYFVGCTTAFKGASQDTAFAISSLLNHFGEDWTLLGEEEWCCGSPLLLAGDEKGVRTYAEHNVEAIKGRGVEKVITGCAACYRVFKREYPVIFGEELPFEVVHAVEYMRDKLSSGEIELEPLKKRVTYHDPCELSRLGGIIKAPRQIMDAFIEDYVELPENGMDVRCCGGGGLLQSTNNDLRFEIIKRRLDQVEGVGVEILTSACPACKLAFTDGVREYKYDLEVLDLLELVVRQLGIV